KQALAQAAPQLRGDSGHCNLAMVVVDDLMGGWTNRYDYEFGLRAGRSLTVPGGKRPKWLKEDWLTAILWSSEPASEKAVREAVQTVVHRVAYVNRKGQPKTLSDILVQEGFVMAAAGCTTPILDPEDIEYTREVLKSFLHVEDKRTIIECLF